jgi:hypothetical protein
MPSRVLFLLSKPAACNMQSYMDAFMHSRIPTPTRHCNCNTWEFCTYVL